jgi:Cd2+/Zn2+-exporting ATPase
MATIPPLFFGGVFMDWLYRALVLLVIACPCSLVISTPVAIASAIGGASRRGILIKGGKYLEALSKIKAVAFDKTRTLTLGEPVVSEVITFNGFAEEMVIADAAGIEKFSSHPLSKSIMDFAQSRGIAAHDMHSYQNFAGKGGRANCLVCEDKDHCIGNLKFIGAESHAGEEVLEKTEYLERQGKTAVLVSEGSKVMGALAIADEIRPESKETIQQLKRAKIKPVIVTGDNEHTARFVARELAIDEVHASLLPDEKVEKVEQVKRQYQHVAMVGDGVNDAPSLATATVGIAMGAGGSDVAIETADVALMNNNLLNIPYAIRLGKKAVITMKQNIWVSLGIKALFMFLALLGRVDLQWAIGADSIMAILVILNSLKLFSVR